MTANMKALAIITFAVAVGIGFRLGLAFERRTQTAAKTTVSVKHQYFHNQTLLTGDVWSVLIINGRTNWIKLVNSPQVNPKDPLGLFE